FYLYELLRGYADNFALARGYEIASQSLISLEQTVFFFLDNIPTVILQNNLNTGGAFTLALNAVLFFFYNAFFWYWMTVGYLIWWKKREYFRPFIYGLVLFSLLDVIIYAFYPTAPPWYAAQKGQIPFVERVLWIGQHLPSDSLSYVNTYGKN